LYPLIYVLSYLAFPLFGWSLAKRIDDRAARLGFAFLAGALLLTIEATLFTIVGIQWNVFALAIPLLVIGGIAWRVGGHAAAPTHPVASLALGVTAIAILHFLLSIVTTQSVSPDFVLFWGTKASRFALAHALDPQFLLSRYPPPRVDYPPLVPIVEAWGALFTHQFPWITAAAMSAVWLLAAVPVIRWLTNSWEATAFWTAAMCASQAFSGGGGNAEAMLIATISIGAAAIVANQTTIAAIAFAAAALTKEEAFITIAAILIGVVIRDRHIKRALILGTASLAGASIWFAYQWRFGLPVGYERFSVQRHIYWSNLPTIFSEAPKSLAAGCWGLAWLIPLAILATRSREQLKRAIPLLVPIPILFAFFVFLYLQYESSLAMRMWWILPRISQPPLSLLILAAAFASGDRMRAP
jgi:hypothetical protein